jgi:hypothetical protein
MGVDDLAAWLLEVQRRSDISVAALLQVGLEEQALQLAAFGVLLGLDVVEREFEGAGGRQPGLKQSELDSCWCGVRRTGACRCHILTVVLP